MKRTNPRELAQALGVDLDNPQTRGTKASTNGQQPRHDYEREPVNLARYPKVLQAVETRTIRLGGIADRSVDAYHVLCACADAKLNRAQGEWVLRRRSDLAEWLDENPPGELARTWEKITQRWEDEKDYARPQGDFEQNVSAELHKLRVREEAKRRFAIEKAGDAPPFDALLLTDTPLFSPEESFRIQGLGPAESSWIVNAQHKTGKTTFILNVTHSLITSEPFLGKFRVHPVDGRVAILNYEVSGPQLGHWARQAGVPDDRLFLVNLRGRRNPFAYPDDLERLAEVLKAQEVESLIVDPFG